MLNEANIGKPFHAREAADSATAERQQRFLSAYAEFGNLSEACQVANVSDESVRLWRKHDVLGFSDQFSQAKEAFADYLEHLARKRLQNPQKGAGSDILLIAMLNAKRPSEFRRDATPAVGRVQVTQIIINAPAQPDEKARIVTVSDAPVPQLPDGNP